MAGGDKGCYLYGIDIGTSSTKGVFINSKGKVIAEAVVEHDFNIVRPGWVEQDPDKCYWGDFKEITKILLEKTNASPEDIKGIGVSGLSPDIVPISKDGNVVRPAIIYMDRRAWRECEELKEKIGQQAIIEKTGNIADPYFAGYKLAWYMKNEPDNYRKTWKVLNADKYVEYKLTDVAAADMPVSLCFAPYFDFEKKAWSEEMSELMGGGIEKLPKIYECHEVVGNVTSKAAKETGLAAGTPVVAAGPDASLSAYSTGMVYPGESCFMYGTTGCWFVVTDKPVKDKMGRLMTSLHIIPGKYIIGGGLIATGALVKWFRDQFGHVEKSMGAMLGSSPYQLMDKEAELVKPGSEGLIVLPYFLGERTPIWDVNAKGMIFGLTLNHTRAHVYRSLLESSGYGLRHHIDIARSLGVNIQEMFAVDGGAKSRLWRQIITDITGVTQSYVSKAAGAPFADAFLAGMAAGIFKRFEEIKDYVTIDDVTKPNQENHKFYSKLYEIYLKLYPHTKEDSDKLSSIMGY